MRTRGLCCLALAALPACGSSRAASSGGDASADAAIVEAAADSAPEGSPDGSGEAAATGASPDGGATTVDPSATKPLEVAGDIGSTYGVSDPSLVWPDGGSTGYLSYTSLAASGLFTRVATTTDGRSFTYLGDANAYADLVVATTDATVCGSTTCSGRLVHETSSIVEDPGDPDPSRRFKLFDYSYVIVPAANPPPQHAWGYIGLYTSGAPEAGWSTGSKAIGWTSSASGVSSDGAATVASTVPALAACAAFTEPAALVDAASGALYLALGCVTQTSTEVVLLRSGDHAATFAYVGELLGASDGSRLGGTSPGLMPSDFFQVEGVTYLIVSTFGTTPSVADAPSGYVSCATVVVDDLGSAIVHRNAEGSPVAVRSFVAPDGGFAGACAFKPGFPVGYLVDEVVATSSSPNQIFPSGVEGP